jgi:hypothetical protein
VRRPAWQVQADQMAASGLQLCRGVIMKAHSKQLTRKGHSLVPEAGDSRMAS